MTVMTADRNLEEQVFQLLKLDLDAHTREVAEEAARLFSDGRHMEAAALVEKADAMRLAAVAPVSPAVAASSDPALAAGASVTGASLTGSAAPQDNIERVVEGLSKDLASSMARILLSAVRDLQHEVLDENEKLTASLREQLGGLRASVDELVPLKECVGRLGESVEDGRSATRAVQESCHQLAVVTAALQDAAVRGEQMDELRRETRYSLTAISDRVSGISGELQEHKEQIGGLKAVISEISPNVASLIEKFDRQTEAIRSLYDTENQRAAALDQLCDGLNRLRSHRPEPRL